MFVPKQRPHSETTVAMESDLHAPLRLLSPPLHPFFSPIGGWLSHCDDDALVRHRPGRGRPPPVPHLLERGRGEPRHLSHLGLADRGDADGDAAACLRGGETDNMGWHRTSDVFIAISSLFLRAAANKRQLEGRGTQRLLQAGHGVSRGNLYGSRPPRTVTESCTTDNFAHCPIIVCDFPLLPGPDGLRRAAVPAALRRGRRRLSPQRAARPPSTPPPPTARRRVSHGRWARHLRQ